MCRRFPLRTDVYSKTAVIPLYLFFVDTSAGGLTHRTHLSVRPYILHRGKHPRRGYGGNRYSDASVLCGYIRRWVDISDAPGRYVPTSHIAGNLLHCGKRTDAGTGAVVIPTHPFFVDASAGRLTQRTHLAGTSLHPASRKTLPPIAETHLRECDLNCG